MKIHILSILLLFSSLQAEQDYFFNHTNPKGQNHVCRLACAKTITLDTPAYDIGAEHNGDDTNVEDYAGSFHKNLDHDATTGLLTEDGQDNYEKLLVALLSADQDDFNAIELSDDATRKFVSPQAAFNRSLCGVPCCILPLPSAPTLTSAHAAAEMIEVYLKAICRDVKFADYGTCTGTDFDNINGGSITKNAADMITDLGNSYKGPSDAGTVTASELFRGPSLNDNVGPYVSQFWFYSNNYLFTGAESKPQILIAQTREFGVKWEDFVAIQNGTVPVDYDNANDFAGGTRYPITARDLATGVHNDGPGEFFYRAVNALLAGGAPLSSAFPYGNTSLIKNEGAFVNLFLPDIMGALFDAMHEALKHAWAHKWRGNRRLRPETMAGLIHRAEATNTNPLNLHTSIFDTLASIDLLAWVKARNITQESLSENALASGEGETYLLGLVYPEGSPTHPAYPAGHAVLAGACATIVKAFFENDTLLKDYTDLSPVKPNPSDPTTLVALTTGEGKDMLTVAGEMDKLASNIALARNFAGVHYRADGDEGILLGEQVAIKVLQDRMHMYPERDFAGYELTKRDGTIIRITPQEIITLS